MNFLVITTYLNNKIYKNKMYMADLRSKPIKNHPLLTLTEKKVSERKKKYIYNKREVRIKCFNWLRVFIY